jgi:hypothetical protein
VRDAVRFFRRGIRTLGDIVMPIGMTPSFHSLFQRILKVGLETAPALCTIVTRALHIHPNEGKSTRRELEEKVEAGPGALDAP